MCYSLAHVRWTLWRDDLKVPTDTCSLVMALDMEGPQNPFTTLWRAPRLHDFLEVERESILERCRRHVRETESSRPTSKEMEEGWPIFYDQLIEVLRRDEAFEPGVIEKWTERGPDSEAARKQGKEFLRLG